MTPKAFQDLLAHATSTASAQRRPATPAEADLLEMVRSGPWSAGNAAAQMIVACAGGKPTDAVANLVLEIDRRRATDLEPRKADEGWCPCGFSRELSNALVAIFVKHPDAFERVRSSTQATCLKPAYETFLAPRVKKAVKSGKRSVPIDGSSSTGHHATSKDVSDSGCSR
jgi:hypothetical protein